MNVKRLIAVVFAAAGLLAIDSIAGDRGGVGNEAEHSRHHG